MSGALRELIAFFGAEVDTKKLDHADEKMKGLAETAEKVAATIGIAFGLHEISEFITKQIELGAELAHTSEILGLSIEDMQAFSYAAANAGLGADEANTALRFLNKNIGEAVDGAGTAGPVFQKFGVQLKDVSGEIRPTKELLSEVADGIAKMHSPAEKTAAAMAVFGRAGAKMIPLLNKGAKGIDELYGEFEQLGGGLSKEFVEAAEKGEHELIKLKTASRGLAGTIASALMPTFTAVVGWVSDAVRWFRELTSHSYIVQTALWTLAGVGAVLAVIWGVLNLEILLVVAAIVALVLAVDEVYTLLNGGKTVIGDFIDSLFGIGTTQEVVRFLGDELNRVGQIIDGLKPLASQLNDMWKQFFGEDMPGGVAILQSALTTTLRTIDKIVTQIGIAAAFASKVGGGIADFAEKHHLLGDAAHARGKGLDALGIGGSGMGVDPSFIGPQESTIVPHAGFSADSMFGAVAQRAPAYVTAPGLAGGATHNGDIVKNTEIHVTNTGLKDPVEAGNATLKAVQKANDEDDNQAAYAAFAGGGGH